MKRAILISGGTLAGVAGVLAYVPTNFGNSSTSPLSAPSTPSSSTAPTKAPTPSSTKAPTNTPAPAPVTPAANKTATGGSFSACGYGNVRVRITVTNGAVTKVDALSYPNGDPRSQFINKQAIPWLQQQTLTAKNSARITGVGGATCTSGAWMNSLQSALTSAGL